MSRNLDFIEWTSQLRALYEHRSEKIKEIIQEDYFSGSWPKDTEPQLG